MRIAVLGTGMVGVELGRALVAGGHSVMMGSRTKDNPKAIDWVSANGPNASHGTFADAASFGEVVLNCTNGAASLEALQAAGADNLAGKILIDVANPLDFSRGMPPTLFVCNSDSLGEQIQSALPRTKVVKALNTLNCYVMANPKLVPGDHVIFVCGNDANAKQQVCAHLREWFGWKRESIVDIGDISGARGTEMVLPLWIRLFTTFGSPMFNFQIVHAPQVPTSSPATPAGA